MYVITRRLAVVRDVSLTNVLPRTRYGDTRRVVWTIDSRHTDAKEATLGHGRRAEVQNCIQCFAAGKGRCGECWMLVSPCSFALCLTSYATVCASSSVLRQPSSNAVQFVDAKSDNIPAFEEFEDRSKPLFIMYRKARS